MIAASATHYATAFAHAIELFTLRGDARVGSFPSPQWVRGLGFSPDGRLLVSSTYESTRFWKVPFPGDRDLAAVLGEATPVREGPGASGRIAFSPDGRRIAEVIGHMVGFRDAGTRRGVAASLGPQSYGDVMEPQSDWHCRNAVPLSLAFSPDGRRLVVGSEEGVFVHDLEAGTLTQEPAAAGRRIDFVGFAADGRVLWAAEGGTPNVLGVEAPESTEFALTPDGRTLLMAAGGGPVHAVELPR